ncbi:MAG: hypothetical protein AcusKO_45290 [Acuticoccus sp.]
METFEGLLETVSAFGPLKAHPWAGVSSERVIGAIDEDEVVHLASGWRHALAAVSEATERAAAALGLVRPESASLVDDFVRLHDAWDAISAAVRDYHDAQDEVRQLLRALDLPRSSEIADIATAADVAAQLAILPDNPHGFTIEELDRDDVAKTLQDIRATVDRLAAARAVLDRDVDLAAAQRMGVMALRGAVQAIASSGPLRFLSSAYRSAKVNAQAVVRGRYDRTAAAGLLVRAADHLSETETVIGAHGSFIGADISAAGARLASAVALEGWIKGTRARFGLFGNTSGVPNAMLAKRWSELDQLRAFAQRADALSRFATQSSGTSGRRTVQRWRRYSPRRPGKRSPLSSFTLTRRQCTLSPPLRASSPKPRQKQFARRMLSPNGPGWSRVARWRRTTNSPNGSRRSTSQSPIVARYKAGSHLIASCAANCQPRFVW